MIRSMKMTSGVTFGIDDIMKNIAKILMMIMMFMVSFSCVEEISAPSEGKNDVVFSAAFDNQTRTILVDGSDVYWLPGDQIAVYGTEEPFICTATEPALTTDFYGTVSETSKYYACYPHSMFNNWMYAPHVVMILPSTQRAVNGTFANELNAAVAYADAEDMTFRFKNVLGYIKFTVPAELKSLVSVTVEAINGEQLSGSFAADCSSDNPTGLRMPNANPFVQLVGNPSIDEGTYYIAMIPGTYTGGLTFTFKTKEDQMAVRTIAKELTLSAGQVRNVGEIKGLSFEDIPSDPLPPDDEIWYITSDGSVAEPNRTDVFGAEILSNTYVDGKGVIKFDGEVTMVGKSAFWFCDKKDELTNVYIPESVTEIGASAFNGCSALTSFTIPKNVTKIGRAAFYSPWAGGIQRVVNRSKNIVEIGDGAFNSDNLCEFIGELVSEDGRCIVVDGCILAFAKGGLTEYTVPSGITSIAYKAFNDCNKLTRITLPDGLLKIGESAFEQCNHMTEFNIPASVEEIGKNAFTFCVKLRSITFPDKVTEIPNSACYGCSGLEEVHFGNNLKSIGENAFYECNGLKSITIPQSVETIEDKAFGVCPGLCEIKGKYASDDNRALIIDDVIKVFAPYGLTEYVIPSSVNKIGNNTFAYCEELVNVTIPEGVKHIGEAAFAGCSSLKDIILPSSLEYIENWMFEYCTSLHEVTCLAVEPPFPLGIWWSDPSMNAPFDKSVIIRVPKESVEKYRAAEQWREYAILGPDEDIYTSSDYTIDGSVTVLNKATVGKGIDIVFMGDGYSDRQIKNGKYELDITKAMNMLFDEEPYESHLEMFNVYCVNVVSATEGYLFGATSLETFFGDGTLVGGNDSKVMSYAQKAISSDRMNGAVIIVMMNREYYAGTCYMYYPSLTGDYGNGLSISYFPLGTDDEMLAGLICHEAGGHGFSKLADEYAYEYMGTISSSAVSDHKSQQDNWGWWKNVDFTDDPSAVRWSYFMNDSRYQYDGLGVYEGGLTYWSGVWRPTENSIMRHNTGGFNAPSREAIYYRIHKLAYGSEWEYDYEDFVEYDARNRANSVSAATVKPNYVEKVYEPTSPPVIIPHAWNE